MKRAIYAAIFAVSCDVEPTTTTPESYVDFLKLSSQLRCEASLRCCGTLCTPKSDAEFYMANPRTMAYLNAGLFAYDRQAAVDCLTALRQRYTSCDAAIPDLPPTTACSKVLRSMATLGGRCETGVNTCSENTYCSNVSSSCTLRRFDGETCVSTNVFCTSESDSCCQSCSGLCTALIPVGGTCTASSSAAQCQAGFYCPTATLKCTAAVPEGQPCNLTTPCNTAAGFVCINNQICGRPQANGASCTDGNQCISSYCLQPNLGTSLQGTCQPLPAPLTVREQLCASR